MTSDHAKPEAGTTGTPSLILEVAGQKEPTPRRFPVLIQNLSMGGVTLALDTPWGMSDWDRYRGKDCVLRMEDSGGQEVLTINGKISWTKVGGTGQPPLSLGVQMARPPEETLRRLSDLLTHTSRDIRGLWDRYDQVQELPGPSHLLRRCYFAGLVFLLGGLALQLTGFPTYKIYGWGLWLLGTLGIAGKILWPLWQKRASVDQIGKTL
jgi:hypothetical protein